MIEPTMFVPQIVAPGITSLNSYIPVPGYGVLPVNAFVIEAQEPILVDTGLASLREQFITGLRSCIALEDLRWIWITHADPDHLVSSTRLGARG